jgi:diketogulonate reductase-like aldo/keto reductase
VTLNNGGKFPQIGLGTFNSNEGDCFEIVKAAFIDKGYRALDTATIYQNEDIIGDALQEVFKSGIKREDVFITTKLW